MRRFAYLVVALMLVLSLVAAAQADAVDLSEMRFTVKGVDYVVTALQDDPALPMENHMDGLPGHAILFGYMGGSDANESNSALFDGVRLIAPDGKEYRTYGNAGNLENPYSLYFGLPEGINLGDCAIKVPADGGEQWFALGADVSVGEAVLDAAAAPEPAAGDINAPGTEEITILYKDEQIVGKLGRVALNGDDNPRQMGKGKMEVSFLCADLNDHIKLEVTDGGMTATAPVTAYASVGGELLKPVDGTFYQDEAFWYFDTQDTPDTVTFCPHGDEDPAKAVTVDVLSGLILSAGDAAAAAPAPQGEPQPEAEQPEAEQPAARPQSTGGYNVNALLEELSEASKDPWEKAIYDEGAEQISQSGDEIRFLLRSFDPRIKSLPDYGEDRQGWVKAFLVNVQQYDIEARLSLADGQPDSASKKALKSQVTKAAAAAKSAFDQKATRIALSELLLPAPTEGEVKGLEDMAPLSGEY